MKQRYENWQIESGGQSVRVKIYRERRMSVRYYLGKSGAILRMPILLTPRQEEQYRAAFADWIQGQLEKRTGLAEQYSPKTYQDGDILQVGIRSYVLSIQTRPRNSHSGRLNNGVIQLTLSDSADPATIHKDIQTLLSRLVAQDCLPHIARRVDELNDRHFQQNIGDIRLKHTHTVWGSCSRKRNINLSTRLLFAPPEVIDYVIIHELAHLIEMNHSKRFWKLVENAMPDYQAKEKWLKKNGHLCTF